MEWRSVQDESGFNQGWAGGRSTKVREERRSDLLMTAMAGAPGRHALEIGCGRGEMARYMAARSGLQMLALDRSKSFIDEARAQTTGDNPRFESFDFMEASERLGGTRFDYIVGNGILHHLYDNLDEALLAMRGLLCEGGRLAFLEPNLHNPYVALIFRIPRLRRLARLEPDEMAFTRRFALRRLTAAGFSDVEVTYRDFLVPGVPDWAIAPLVAVGQVAEKTPVVRHVAQSLFITARSATRP